MSLPLALRHVVFDPNTSASTGSQWLAADARQITLSIQTAVPAASRFTVIGTNDDGLRTALGTPLHTVDSGGWSIVTVVTAPGLYNIAAGLRWLNVFRASGSTDTATFHGRT